MVEINRNVPMIDKHVPMPTSFRGESQYPFADMEIGDSIFFPANTREEKTSIRGKLSGAASNYASKQGGTVKFTTRTLTTGVRCWRIK